MVLATKKKSESLIGLGANLMKYDNNVSLQELTDADTPEMLELLRGLCND